MPRFVKKVWASAETPHFAEGYSFVCPGCSERPHAFIHTLYTWKAPGAEKLLTNKDIWRVSGEGDLLTFSPSLLMSPDHLDSRCHSFIREGKIQFLGDCWHSMKNKTVDIPEIPEWLK